MPGFALHQVGAGYIDVREAVERATSTPGERAAFLAGDTAWSSQGLWTVVADGDARLGYSGNWRVRSSAGATDGSYREVSAKGRGGSVRALVTRSTFKLLYPTNAQGGIADVYVDGVERGRVSFFSATPGSGSTPFSDLGIGAHHVEVRAIDGNTYVDGFQVEGQLFADDTVFVEVSQTFSGTMGASALDMEIDRYPIAVGPDVTTLKATLGWTGGVDVDLYLVDPNGERVASGATSSNPESLEYTVKVPGTYTYEVTGFATLAANYTLTSTQTRAVLP